MGGAAGFSLNPTDSLNMFIFHCLEHYEVYSSVNTAIFFFLQRRQTIKVMTSLFYLEPKYTSINTSECLVFCVLLRLSMLRRVPRELRVSHNFTWVEMWLDRQFHKKWFHTVVTLGVMKQRALQSIWGLTAQMLNPQMVYGWCAWLESSAFCPWTLL